MLYFTILFVFNEKCDSLFKVVCIQFFLTFFFTCDVSFFFYRCCLFLFWILPISFNRQVLPRNLLFVDLYMYSFEMRRMWFRIKWDWQPASRKPNLAACGVSGRSVILSFNFNCNFFKRHSVIVQLQKRSVIFLTKELKKEQNYVLESPNSKTFSFR